MEQRLEPHRVTKPIQLLAAWLVGLVIVDGSFLSAASLITRPDWVTGALVVAAIVNVPLFLLCIFLLQTRFRPEMQEDSFYAHYLEVRESTRKPPDATTELQTFRQTVSETTERTIAAVEQVRAQLSVVVDQLASPSTDRQLIQPGSVERALEEAKTALQRARDETIWSRTSVSLNDLLSNYKAIRGAFRNAQIPVADTFGSASNLSKAPAHFVVAVGGGVPPTAVRRILEIVIPLGAQYLNVATEDHDIGNLYVGAYGYTGEPVMPLTPKNVELLSSITDAVDLRQLILSSPVRVETTSQIHGAYPLTS